MIKRLLSLCGFCFLCVGCLAQSTEEDTVQPERSPLLVLKWPFLTLVDPETTVQFGAEYLPKQGRWSVQQEIGFGNFTDFSIDADEMNNKEIWRFRTEGRWYTGKFVAKPKGAFIALELLYKRVNFDRETAVGRSCGDGGCDYFQRMSYRIFRDVGALHVKAGRQFILGRRFTLELYTGIGGRYISVRATVPADADVQPGWDGQRLDTYRITPGNSWTLSATMGCNVGFIFLRR